MSVASLLADNTYKVKCSKITLPNDVCGSATLVAGVATVNTPHATTASKILLTGQDNNVVGTLSAGSLVDGVSFQIRSSNVGDSGVAGWLIVE